MWINPLSVCVKSYLNMLFYEGIHASTKKHTEDEHREYKDSLGLLHKNSRICCMLKVKNLKHINVLPGPCLALEDAWF